MIVSKPRFALSIRQPWAWLIVNGFKDVENRTWRTHFRGRIYVHAAKGMTRAEYDEARRVALHIRPAIELPAYEEMERGGIVGAVDVTGCEACDFDERKPEQSPWAIGPFAFTLANAEALPFRACRGSLGFFKPEGAE